VAAARKWGRAHRPCGHPPCLARSLEGQYQPSMAGPQSTFANKEPRFLMQSTNCPLPIKPGCTYSRWGSAFAKNTKNPRSTRPQVFARHAARIECRYNFTRCRAYSGGVTSELIAYIFGRIVPNTLGINKEAVFAYQKRHCSGDEFGFFHLMVQPSVSSRGACVRIIRKRLSLLISQWLLVPAFLVWTVHQYLEVGPHHYMDNRRDPR